MNKYELVVIINPDLGTEENERLIGNIQSMITDNGGVIARTDIWGRRKLAYEIKKNKDGFYVLMRFEAQPPFIQRLVNYLRLDEQVLKYIVLRPEKLPEISPLELQGKKAIEATRYEEEEEEGAEEDIDEDYEYDDEEYEEEEQDKQEEDEDG